MTEDSTLLPCPFCKAEIRHVESLARSFNPPRTYHEYHHPRNECMLFDGVISSFTDDPTTRLKWIEAWNRRAAPVKASRSGEVAQLIHHHFKPANMTDADWQGGAVLGKDNSWRAQVNLAAQDIAILTTPRPSELVAALREIERLRLATNEGSLRVRADRMWEIATAALATPCLAASRPTVGVKALEWYPDPGAFPHSTWGAQSSFGRFTIEEISASDSPAYEVRYTPHHLIAIKDGLDEAKSAAQTDYEARIRSALTPIEGV